MAFKRGVSFFTDKLLDVHDWNVNVMRDLEIKGYCTAAHTLFSGAGQVLYQAKLYLNHDALQTVNRMAHFTEFALTLGCSLDDMDGTHDPHQRI